MHVRVVRTALSAGFLASAALLLAGSALAVTITSFTPTSGLTQTPADGSRCSGAVISISGTGFISDGPVTSVSFNGVPSPYVQVGSDVTVFAMVPDQATTGPITVTEASGTAISTTPFTVNVCPYGEPVKLPEPGSSIPSITNFAPTKAKTGMKLVITGTNFTDATRVKIGGVVAVFKVNSATKIVVTVPARAKSGKVSVTTEGGTTTSNKAFTKL
jgi:IPT/TIG domain